MKSNDDLIYLNGSLPNSLKYLINKFKDYQFLKSLIILKYEKLPTLKTIIISNFNKDVENRFFSILKANKWESLMLRRDALYNVHLKPRGGDIYNIDNLIIQIKKSIDDGFMVILHPPYSRYDNYFSGNILFNGIDNNVIVELVTNGFDLSDINRGDSIPHERFVINGPNDVPDWSFLTPLDIREHTIISHNLYNDSWHNRLNKIYNKMIKSKIKQDEMTKHNYVKDYLKLYDMDLLFHVENNPALFGFSNLCNLYKHASIFFINAKIYGYTSPYLSLGFGILKKKGLIFWNVFTSYE